jgi:hypothetical protein
MSERCHQPCFARSLIAPCLLYVSKEADKIPCDAEVCSRIVQLLRDVKLTWASEALASSLIPHVPLLMSGRHSLFLLGVAMCYSRSLFLKIYEHLLVLLASSFSRVDRDLLKDVYCLTHMVYRVAKYVPTMEPYVCTMLHSLYAQCTSSR